MSANVTSTPGPLGRRYAVICEACRFVVSRNHRDRETATEAAVEHNNRYHPGGEDAA